MGLTSTSIDKDNADFRSSKSGGIWAWVNTEVDSQTTTQTSIKYTYGLEQDHTYSDSQRYYASTDGDTQYDETYTNSKGSGSYYFHTEIITYTRPAYGSAAGTHTSRVFVSGIYDGDTADTDSHTVLTSVPAKAGVALGAPGSFASSGVTSSAITYSWTAPASSGIGPAATSYILQLATDAGFAALVYNANVGNVLSKAVTGLARHTTYYARVLAVNSVGNGAWSSTNGATTLATVPDAMATPTLSVPTSGGFNVNFVAPNDGGSAITSYTIEVSKDNFATISNTFTGVTTSPKILTGLTPGAKYRARIKAINAIGTSTVSATSAEISTLGGVKIWNGTTWGTGLVRCWNGTAWQIVQVRKWNGTSWVI